MNASASPEQIAANARKARKREFSTQLAAALKIGCSRTTVVGWENRKSPTPLKGSEYLLDAARAYKVRAEWLSTGIGEDGYPWTEAAPEQSSGGVPDVIPDEAQSDLATGLEALSRIQTYLMQALAATIPTAAREVLAALDSRLPSHLRDVKHIKVIRTAILGQLANNDMAAMPRVLPKKSHPSSHHKSR